MCDAMKEVVADESVEGLSVWTWDGPVIGRGPH